MCSQLLDSIHAFGNFIFKKKPTKANSLAYTLFASCPFQILSFSCLDIDGNHRIIQYIEGK